MVCEPEPDTLTVAVAVSAWIVTYCPDSVIVPDRLLPSHTITEVPEDCRAERPSQKSDIERHPGEGAGDRWVEFGKEQLG